MSDQHEPEDALRARLRAEDPAASLSPADPEWTARLLEDTMSTDLKPVSRENGMHNRTPLTWLVAAAALVLIAGVGLFAILGIDNGAEAPPTADDPTVTELSAVEAPGRCAVPTAKVLAANAAIAFDGTVVSIEDGEATIDVREWYAGEETDQVVVADPARSMQQLVMAVDLQEGERFLGAGTQDGQLMVCGFSGPYSGDLAAMYSEAFGG